MDEGSGAADGHPGAQPHTGMGGVGAVGERVVDEDVVIRVCDEARNVTKTFTCKKSLLLSRMKYFRNYLTTNSAYDIDISVHCDVLIFEWLMRYIHRPDHPPPLDCSSVVSILISSEFLEMEELIDLCLTHISKHLNEILRIPLDFTCLSDKVIQSLAQLCSPEMLSSVKVRAVQAPRACGSAPSNQAPVSRTARIES
jgi:hypothetical protein